jgi:SMODS and SLOG-associating 2TM effector domain 1/Protein of unknown function (DUF4231)
VRPELLDELWREQSVWSQTANRMKARIEHARLGALLIVVAVAVCATGAAALHGSVPVLGKVLAGAAALGSAVLPLLRPAWSGVRLKDWTRARSVSEALKADVYLYLAGAGAFADDPHAVVLRERTDRLRRDAADLLPQRTGLEPVKRDLPAVHDLPSFFAVRVRSQYKDYYRAKVTFIAGRIRRFRLIEIGLGVVGAALGAAAAVVGASFAGWIAVLATAGTAMSVHVSATRYEFQLIEFSRTAEELRQIGVAAAADGVGADELKALAVRAERVISVENQGWMAKLAEDPPAQKAPEAEKP